MNLLNLVVLLFVLIAIDYFVLFRKELVSPAILFNSGFLICSLILLSLSDVWKVNIHDEIFWLLSGCNISFVIGAFTVKKFSPFKSRNLDSQYRTIQISRLKFFLAFQICAYCIKVYFLSRYYGMGSLGANLFAHTFALKFGGEIMDLPMGLGFIYAITDISGYFLAFLLAIYLSQPTKNKLLIRWLCFNFLVNLMGSLLSSGRSALLWMIISFCVCYVVAIHAQGRKIKSKVMFNYAICTFVFLICFQRLGYMIGREESSGDSLFQAIGVYCGAEIQNLNDFTFMDIAPRAMHWGEFTFISLYQSLGFEMYNTVQDYLPFNIRNGYNLGNVATAIHPYYFDFGLSGAMIVCFLIGVVLQVTYNIAKNSSNWRTGNMSIGVFVYVTLIPTAFMSFFSEAFVHTFIALFNIKLWMRYLILYWILYNRLPINK